MKHILLSGGILAALMLANGCQQAVEKPAPPVTAGNGSTLGDAKPASRRQIRWAKSWDAALKESRRTNTPIMVDFYATWCGPCKMLAEEIYTNDAVIEQSQKWIAVKIDVDKNQKLADKYGVSGLPTVGFLKPDGKVITGFQGVPKAAKLVEIMESAADKWDSKSGAA
jgi:thioredoxin